MSIRDDHRDLGDSSMVRGNGEDRGAPSEMPGAPDRVLERIYRQGVENEERITVTFNALSAHIADSAAHRQRANDRARKAEESSAADRLRVGRIEGGVLELVARAHRQDAEIERVRRSVPTARGSSPESEFMTEAARQGLALARLDREEFIAARRKRNAALVKVAVGVGLALVAAGSSLATHLLSR